ncbi:hypothetical protein [Nocardia sp. NPDC058666]|uniref:hypothetical protein n=1 Tax=Nocardia sp. NPDC058666 TaxID=3346587 RepID=UPI00365D2B52
MSDRLSSLQRAVLLVLLAEARELTNAELKEVAGLSLTGKPRVQLNELGLVESTTPWRNILVHELTELGAQWCTEELSRPAPARAGSFGGALYSVLGGLHRYLDGSGQLLTDIFQPDVAGQIVRAYAAITDGKPEQVRLADVRTRLPHLSPDEFTRAIVALADREGVHVRAEADRKTLTEDDRAVAVSLGGTARHLLTIEVLK